MSASLARFTTTRVSRDTIGTRSARAAIILALGAGAIAGLSIGAHAPGGTGDGELTRLLRAMAVLKLLFVAAAASAILWRLQASVTPRRLAAYALVSFAMAMGPGLIWFLAYIAAASFLLHGGVAGAVVLLWRDNASSELLETAVWRWRASRP